MAYFRFFKVVDVAWLNGYSVVRMSIVYISMKSLTSVFNIPQLEQQQQEPDYRSLYEKQKRLRVFFQKKSKQLESRLRTLSRDGSSIVSKPKQLDICGMLEQIKSFKSLLPYSVKQIPVVDSQCSLDYGLFKEWAVYGIAEEQLARIEQGRKYEGNLVSGNAGPSQILQHTARLVFPSGTTAKVLSGKEALDYSLDIVNLTNEKLKSFVLSFEPNYNKQVSNDNQSRELDILNLLNPERRVYAVCVEVQDFTILEQESKMIQLKTPRKKSEKTVKFKQVQIQPERPCGGLKVVASKRVYCIFTYYPCFSFFEQLLKSLFHAIKVERYITFKQGGQNLRAIDSKFHVSLVKEALEKLRKSANKPIVPDKLMDFQLCGKSKVYLQLSMDSLNFLLAQEWAFSVLSLFTLDVFLDVLTLLMLQQKLVFVCSNPTILTYAVFLFTKILIRPFEYPYPVVNIIPDQQDYLNAPFPVVYGYLKTREEIMANKIPKRYKNVYVVFEPTGVEIISEECKRKILSKKSPRLRDRLISKFKKMQRNFPTTTFFSFLQKKSLEFCFSSNKELARQIIAEVHSYISNDLFRLLPGQGEVATIKTFLATARNIDEDEMNQQVFLRIKEEYSGRTKDPFFSAFLDTQLLNVHIFKY